MTINFSLGEEPPVDLLEVVERHCQDAAEGLVRTVEAIRTGQQKDATAAVAAIRELRAALQTVMLERNNLEKLRRQGAGAVGARSIDFDAARDEIGRRLACLRNAGPGG
jgi:hypothetical protein